MLASSADEWRRLGNDFLVPVRAHLPALPPVVLYESLRHACECHLKGALMSMTRMNRWPSREEQRSLYQHDLSSIARGPLLDAINARARRDVDFRAHWRMIRDMEVGSRYTLGIVQRSDIVDLRKAALDDEHGVVTWLRRL